MALNSAYYDTCVFAESLNPVHPESAACGRLLDVGTIAWQIFYCAELTLAESTITEFVEAFEVSCASNGIDVRRIAISSAKATAKKHLGLKKRLQLLGLTGRDWAHLMATTHSSAAGLCTVDLDFWDPANKANPGAANLSIKVKQDIENSLPLLILKPSEFLAA